MASKWIGSKWAKVDGTTTGTVVGEVTLSGKHGPYKNLVVRYADGTEANTTLGVLRTYFRLYYTAPPAVPVSSPLTLFGLLPVPR